MVNGRVAYISCLRSRECCVCPLVVREVDSTAYTYLSPLLIKVPRLGFSVSASGLQ